MKKKKQRASKIINKIVDPILINAFKWRKKNLIKNMKGTEREDLILTNKFYKIIIIIYNNWLQKI